MKRVIEINEDYYEIIKHDVKVNGSDYKPFVLIANSEPYEEPMRIIYLCDDHGCPGCEAGTNPEHECKHTTDIAHAKNFEAMLNEETGEVVGYYEKPEHIIAQFTFNKDKQKEFADEAAQRIREEIENGELIVKNSCRPVIIHHNGRDFEGYYDSSRNLLFGSSLAAEVAEEFGFTWSEIEENENQES